ncbi:thymidylate kinase [archaeon]|jgi:dTMP kinase|nr:thymidylate kinase [archaeon]MBT4352070.1 thymidylate kinase [archaeon]MBT4647181.1 thymidylate kinase [archaeon]MBT6822184.1 thymidylate kinase [archaeon]MBT7391741.1 thymidylate kinase [archaeon]
MTGKIIVLEGVDASGKGTQTKILIENLIKKGYDIKTKDFPQYYTSFYGKLIGKFLKGEFGDPTEIDPYSSSILYAGDRFEGKEDLNKWKEEGKIIILNRYVPSNLAFNRAKFKDDEKKEKFTKWIENLEYDTNEIPKPDLVMFLDVPLSVSQEWIKTKKKRDYIDGEQKDQYESNKVFLQKVYNEYVNICNTRNNWINIKCVNENIGLSVDEISKSIFNEVNNILK